MSYLMNDSLAGHRMNIQPFLSILCPGFGRIRWFCGHRMEVDSPILILWTDYRTWMVIPLAGIRSNWLAPAQNGSCVPVERASRSKRERGRPYVK